MRFCFGQGSCTQLLGAGSAYVQAQKIAPTLEQKATLQYLFFQTPSFYETPQAPMLVTRSAISFQLGVPSNQWEAEVENWVQFLLAVTQTAITHIAAGPGIVRSGFDLLAEPLEWSGICKKQRIGAPNGYSNINASALIIVVAISTIIIFLNLSLVMTLKYLHRRNRLSSEVMAFWNHESILQVQRKAYEGAGYSSWQNRDAAVPRLENDILIPGLGTKEFEGRFTDEAPVETNTLLLQGLSTSSHTSCLPLLPSFSSNPHLPIASSAGEQKTVSLLDEVESKKQSHETSNTTDVQSRTTLLSRRTSEEQSSEPKTQYRTINMDNKAYVAVNPQPGLSDDKIGQENPDRSSLTLAIESASQAFPPSS
jgi:hypothetical protein